jgi:hypothetical protein
LTRSCTCGANHPTRYRRRQHDVTVRGHAEHADYAVAVEGGIEGLDHMPAAARVASRRAYRKSRVLSRDHLASAVAGHGIVGVLCESKWMVPVGRPAA